MKKHLSIVFLTFISLTTLFLNDTFSQTSTQFNLPDNALTRIGKGRLSEVKYSTDGSIMAVVSSIGVWLYNTQTYEETALLTEDTQNVFGAAFSPNGQTLASAN